MYVLVLRRGEIFYTSFPLFQFHTQVSKADWRLTWMSLSYGLWREHERAIFQKITHFCYRVRYSVRLDTLREKRFLSSHQQAVQRKLKAALYSCRFSLREKWRQGDQQPCSQHRVYPTKLHVSVHMAQYIWLRERTRTCTHTQHTAHKHTHICHVNPWDNPFQGGVDDGRAFQLVETAC